MVAKNVWSRQKKVKHILYPVHSSVSLKVLNLIFKISLICGYIYIIYIDNTAVLRITVQYMEIL
jgi:hypothetical protein